MNRKPKTDKISEPKEDFSPKIRNVHPEIFKSDDNQNKNTTKEKLNPEPYSTKKIFLKVLWLILPLTVLAMSVLFVWLYLFSDLKAAKPFETVSSEQESRLMEETLPHLSQQETLPKETVEIVEYPEEQINLLIVGVDSRDMQNINTNADAILVLSINQKKGEIKLSSYQRDLYIYVPWKERFQKLNSVMFGGPEALMNLLNYNYKLNIQKYAVVNFQALSDLVDLVGGVEVEIPDNQVLIDHLNFFVGDSNRLLGGEASPAIEKPGLQTLTGRQALAFARIRYIDTDFLRMKRQQQIIKGLFQKVKQQGPLELVHLVKTAVGYLRTNLTSLEIAGLATSVLPKLNQNLETLSVPIEGYYKGVMLKGTYYTVQALNAQLPLLHEFIYGNQNYVGSKVPEYYPSQEELNEIARQEAEEKERAQASEETSDAREETKEE